MRGNQVFMTIDAKYAGPRGGNGEADHRSVLRGYHTQSQVGVTHPDQPHIWTNWENRISGLTWVFS